MPRAIKDLADKYLTNPAEVSVTPTATTVDRIEQSVTMVNQAEKAALLALILKGDSVERALVFSRTKHGADKVVKVLAKAGIEANAIHGNKSQNHRERVLAAFRTGEIRTLVATDIAARGIDVDGISHVVNYDLPNVPETYVHRIGRTARAGAEGVAISLIAGAEEMGYLRDIERLIRISLPREDRRTPGRSDAAAAATQRPAQHRGGRSAPRAHTARSQDTRGHESRNHESRGHESRGHESAPGSKGPRRPRRGGGNNAAPQPNRHEQPRPAQQAGKGQSGKSEGIQGVAFLHRESRPNNQPNRSHRPQR
jgi:ATP-dependent RNA helicase RhlE